MEENEINKKEMQEQIKQLEKKLAIYGAIALLLFFVINLIFSFIDKLVSDSLFHGIFAVVSIVAITIDRYYSFVIKKMCKKQIVENGQLNKKMKVLCISTIFVMSVMALLAGLIYLMI